MEISRRHLHLLEATELQEKMQLLIGEGVESGNAVEVGTRRHHEIEEQQRLARNQRRVAMKRAKKAARKAK